MKSGAESRVRALPAVIVLVVLALAAGVLLFRFGPSAPLFPKCPLHSMTGLHCPGCGMTRAAHALLHGDVAAAFRFNPLGMALIPLGLVAFAAGMRRMGPKTAWVLALVVIVFGVLRNLPGQPFELLAPP